MVIRVFKIMLLSSLLSLTVIQSSYAESFQAELLKVADKKVSGEYVRQQFLTLMKKTFEPNNKKKLLIIGDSHAQDFVNTIFENGYLKDYQIATRDIPTRCQPILGENETSYIDKKDQAFCAKADSLKKAKEQIEQADVVILVANWKKWSAKELPKTIKNLQLKPEQKLVVIGRKSFGKVSIRKYLRKSAKELRNLRNNVDDDQQKINGLLKASLSDKVFVDLQQLVCGSDSSCRVFTSDLKLISFDGGHLTKEGAAYVGRILFKHPPLADL